jgi:uncharacterized phage protein (TIGR02220 family)
MTGNQESAFFRLLCYAWLNADCALPSNAQALLKLTKGIETEEFQVVLACFKPHPTTPNALYNPRLHKEWLAARARQEMLTTRAEKGAQARWGEKPKKVQTLKPSPIANGRDYQAESKEVLAFLNDKTRKHFREVDATLGFIQARLKSGIDVQTCRTVIMRKIHDWKDKPDMQIYLRPETLFNKTKFEGYLAEVTK